MAHVGQRIEREVVGIQRGVLVDHLDQRRVDMRLVRQAVVIGLVSENERAVLVDILVTVHPPVVIANRAVAGNHGSVVVKDYMADQQQSRRIAHLEARHHVGAEIDRRRRLGPKNEHACGRRGQQ